MSDSAVQMRETSGEQRKTYRCFETTRQYGNRGIHRAPYDELPSGMVNGGVKSWKD